jgi:predicted ATP-binding protein involved in virulence
MQQKETKKTRRIRQITVTNLFGTFNHVIPLNVDEHITIIHGPNGFGKTMMLKLLHALFSQNNRFLQSIPFDEFKVDFDDNTSFWVRKTPLSHDLVEGEEILQQQIVFHATGNESYILNTLSLLKGNAQSILLYLRRHKIPTSRVELFNAWRCLSHDEELSYEDIIERLDDQLPSVFTRKPMPEWLVDIRKSVSIRFIETQRLLSSTQLSRQSEHDKTTSEYAVTEDSKHLVEMIRRKLAESATLSQSLDRSFPKRVISPTTQQLQLSEDELRGKLQRLEEKRSRLMSAGLLNQETDAGISFDQEIASNTKAVLAVYAEDTEQKLGIFDELVQKIDLLSTIINNRFLYKTMAINKENGLVFTTKNGIVLPLENLSSGEQHELVLFYDLLFRVTSGSLILIDEPELSLYVVWQEKFLEDVQQITKLADIDIILATHSPDIISNRRDLVVELEGPVNGKLQ